MKMSKEDYFFYEWLLLAKHIDTEEKFNKITPEEFQNLKAEFIRLYVKTI
jgi:hypothetical protein